VTDRPIILGIESSCDETAAAVVRAPGELLSSVVASQIPTHALYGGVVPELASREHLQNISPVVREALAQAGLKPSEIDAVAVTRGPGLAGALMVGVCYAKSLAWALGKPILAVNHIEGHIHAVLLEEAQKQGGELQFPVLALVVSGGHTHLYLAERKGVAWSYAEIGHTRDDAAGEAFDKTAKMLGLTYPGGPIIEKLARQGDERAVPFSISQLKHADRKRTLKRGSMEAEGPRFDFSYSGVKTAVLRHVELNEMQASIEQRRQALIVNRKPTDADWLALCDQHTLDLIASFQYAVVRDLTKKTMNAVEAYGVKTLLVTGGVAANGYLRAHMERAGAERRARVLFPSRPLSTDNAAMIASAGCSKWLSGDFAGWDLAAEANLPLR